MSKRSYKVMQDIDLSQNDLLKVKNIQNVDDEIVIKSDKIDKPDSPLGRVTVQADEVVLTTNTSIESKIKVTPNKIDIANTPELSVNSNTTTINANTLNLFGNSLLLTSATVGDSPKRSTFEVQDSYVEIANVKTTAKVKKVELDSIVDIKWDSTTNSLLFEKIGN